MTENRPFPIREALCFAGYGTMIAAHCLGIITLPGWLLWAAYGVFLVSAGATLEGIRHWQRIKITPANPEFREVRHEL